MQTKLKTHKYIVLINGDKNKNVGDLLTMKNKNKNFVIKIKEGLLKLFTTSNALDVYKRDKEDKRDKMYNIRLKVGLYLYATLYTL